MLIPIVDERDEVIGYKERNQLDHSQDIFRTAGLWITNSRGDVLLAQRKLNKKLDPGRWGEAVGGTVDGHDSYEQTIIREAKEELGLANFSMQIGPKQFVNTDDYKLFVQWYKACIDQEVEGFTIQEEEVEQIAWFPGDWLRQDIVNNPDKYVQDLDKYFDSLM